MAQIALISGIYSKQTPDFARSFPINLMPVAESGDGSGSGISRGLLKLSPGVTTKAATDKDRGGTVWNGQQFRVLGTTLYTVAADGALASVGDVGAGNAVQFAQSFDRLAVASDGSLYYWDGKSLAKVTDTDLGPVLSMTWQDGYFITTDGTSIVVTELADPTAVDPLKYGSSEADPDPVTGVLSFRGELYALNRFSIEVFSNQGTTGFPFSRQRGAQIPKGCVGAAAFSLFVETFAFCGSGRNEAPAIYLAGAGQAIKISPRALDEALAALTDDDLALVELESRNAAGMTELLVHLPAETWVYHWTASQQLDLPVWSKLAGGADCSQAYPARHFTLFNGQWWCGGAAAIGVVDEDSVTTLHQPMGYQFDTPLIYNAGTGAIVHSAELVTLGGRGAANSVGMSYTDDGRTWSNERFCATGGIGDRQLRVSWRRLGRIANWRGFRFRGVANSPIAFARLEANLEGLNG